MKLQITMKNSTKNAFAAAARQGVATAIGVGIAGLFIGSYDLLWPAVVFSALAGYNTAERYEKKLEATVALAGSLPPQAPSP